MRLHQSIISTGFFVCVLLTSSNAVALIYGDIDAGYGPVGSNSVDGWDNQSNGLFGYQLNVGINFLPFLAVEAGYNGFANIEYKDSSGTEADTTLNGYHVALKGQIDLPFDVYVMGKAGLGSLVQSSFKDVGTKINYNLYWSVGGGYNINDTFYIEGAYSQIQGSSGVPTAGLGSVGFGINLL